MIEEPDNGFNGGEYWASKVLIFDALTRDWAAEDCVGFRGEDVFNALAKKRDADASTKEYQLAHEMTWRMLSKASMQKITHGKNLTRRRLLVFYGMRRRMKAKMLSRKLSQNCLDIEVSILSRGEKRLTMSRHQSLMSF